MILKAKKPWTMKHRPISVKQNITAISIFINHTSKRLNFITFLP